MEVKGGTEVCSLNRSGDSAKGRCYLHAGGESMPQSLRHN